jgi:hypothetical protein
LIFRDGSTENKVVPVIAYTHGTNKFEQLSLLENEILYAIFVSDDGMQQCNILEIDLSR